MNFETTFGLANEYAAISTNEKTACPERNIVQVKWNPPSNGMIKLNTDGATKRVPGPGGCGGILRDHQNRWVMGFYTALALTTPLEAELKAIKCGLQLAAQHNITHLEIESDALEALECILTGTPFYDNLICHGRSLLSKLEAWVLRHVFREQNWTADCMAKEGARTRRFGDIRHKSVC